MTAKIKLNAASGGGSFSLQAPSSSANNRVFTLPDVADATMATVNGITMADKWRMSDNANYTNNDYITSNWYRLTGTNGGNIGSAMTQSSGVFTFPETGLYNVVLSIGFYHYSGAAYLGCEWHLSTDGGSSYAQMASAYVAASTQASYHRLVLDEFIDVTNASNFKIKFRLKLPSQTTIQGGERTSLKVIKYGET